MKISSATSVGKIRAVNEDSFFVSEIAENNTFFAIVADGMGGHNAGEIASAKAVKIIKDELTDVSRPSKDLLSEAIAYANNSIYKMSAASPDLYGMGTTVTACIAKGKTLTVAQVGDSRLYLIRDGKITQITKDHSLVEMLIQSGEITKEDAKNHPQKNVITRALGTNNFVETDIYELKLEKDDVILLCSDGLVNMVDDDKILSTVIQNKDFNTLSDILVKEAENAGGHDNITVVLIKFDDWRCEL